MMPLCDKDLTALLQLNNDHALELSLLTAERLATLIKMAFYTTFIADHNGFLLSFDQDAAYDGTNFLWFKSHYARFVYVDRVVVARAARGQGLATTVYQSLFKEALARGHSLITCEVNSNPPNPASDAFHASLGFEPVGVADLPGHGKSVQYLCKNL